MRKLVIVTLTLLLLVGYGNTVFAAQTIKLSDAVNGITLLERDQNGLTLKVSVGSLEVDPVGTKAGTFTLLAGQNFDHSSMIGEPSLPVANQLLAIPLGCDLSAEVTSSEVQEFSLTDFGASDRLLPVQPSLSKSANPADVPFEFRQDVYLRSGYYQLQAAATEVVGIMRGIRVGRISIAPVQYNVAENRIKVYSEMIIRISFNNADWAATKEMYSNSYSPAFEPAYDMLMNSDDSSFRPLNDLTRYPMTLVIVSHRMFEAQLQPFIAWKIKKGFKVIVGYTDVIGTTTATIKTYLQNLYNTESPKPTYVLFCGDVGQVPTWSGTSDGQATDRNYCEYTGDNVPEVYYGRFSAQTTAQMQPQIDKTLEYEQYLMPDPSYLAHAVMVSGVDGTYAATYGNGQINYGTNLYFNAAHGITPHVWLYPASDAAGAAAAVIAQVNSGISFANYTAHGGETGWSDPPFSVSDVAGMTNDHKYGLLVGNACITGSYAYSSNCFGEALLQKVNGGSIGYIGSSDNTYWDEDYWWGVGGGKAIVAAGPPYDATKLGSYDGTFHDHDEATTEHYVTQGAMIFCGLLAVEQSSSSRKLYYWEEYNLLGDPSVSNYMHVPSTNTISHMPSMMMTSTTFAVTADVGSYVALSSGGVLHGAGLIPAGGTLDLPVTAFGVPCAADLVITGQNKIPYSATVQIIAPNGPYIVHDGHTINDAAGNNNGMIDFGENILLGVQLINVGPDASTGILAVLSTTDSYATITDATEDYGTMDGNMTTKNIADAFAFTVDPLIPDGHTIKFDVTVHGTGGDSIWTSSFNVTAHAPSVAYLSVTVIDIAGNNNGILDPGETAPVVITLKNTGTGQAFNVAATLSELDDKVEILDDQGAFGNIAGDGGVGSNTTNTFIVKADPTCPMGHSLLAKLTITADGGYATSSNFNMTIGDRVAFFLEDFTAEQGWEGLATAAQWQIGPAIGGSNGSYPADPSDDHTPTGVNMILGNNLGNPGSYANSLSQTYWCNSPVIDCSNASGVILNYWHQLGCESSSYDHAYFEVFDGENWINLFSNAATLDESQWTESEYDISQYADGNPLFQLRWGLGSTDGSQIHGGWNIDDIQLKGYVTSSAGAAAYTFAPETINANLLGGDSTIASLLVSNSGQSNLRIRFTSGVGWLQCPITQNIIAPGENITIPVLIRSAGLALGANSGVLNFVSNVPGHTTGTIPANVYILIPQIATTPASVAAYVDSGATASKQVIITNAGPGRLNYAVSYNTGKTAYTPPVPQQPVGTRIADPDKTGFTEPYYAPVTKNSGGPDAFGYTWKDSDNPGGPAYSWIDIAATGTNITSGLADDNVIGPFSIGFNFPFYDTSYSQFWIGSNGLIGFGSSANIASLLNTVIPKDSLPNNFIAWCWDDLNITDGDSPGGKVLMQNVDGNLVIEFKAYPEYELAVNPGETITAEVILSPSGKIKIQYQYIAPGFDHVGCTVGIENPTGLIGLPVVVNATYLKDELAIQFKHPDDTWLSATPMGGIVNPGSKDTIDVRFDATDCIDDTYAGLLTLVSNAPTNPTISIPITMTVGAMRGDADNSGAVDISDVVYLIAYIFSGGQSPDPIEAGDANCDGTCDISDSVYLIAYIFSGGAPPCTK